jgi:hypothetical protein
MATVVAIWAGEQYCRPKTRGGTRGQEASVGPTAVVQKDIIIFS